MCPICCLASILRVNQSGHPLLTLKIVPFERKHCTDQLTYGYFVVIFISTTVLSLCATVWNSEAQI